MCLCSIKNSRSMYQVSISYFVAFQTYIYMDHKTVHKSTALQICDFFAEQFAPTCTKFCTKAVQTKVSTIYRIFRRMK